MPSGDDAAVRVQLTLVNRERVRLWVDALRSGRFEQAEGGLRQGKQFCCLGVACEVAREEGLDLHVQHEGGNGWSYNGEVSTLPIEVVDWLGMRSANPWISIDPGGNRIAATVANDMKHWTFAEIADGLENMYLNDNNKEASA